MGTSPGSPRPHGPWLLVPLLVVAGTTAPLPQRVNRVLGGSVLLSPLLPPGMTVTEIEWSFSAGAGAGAAILVAEFGPYGFERPDPEDRFKNRLEMLNQTALKIEPLELGDSGVYTARIKRDLALVEDRSFNLSVYEPLRELEIQPQLLSFTTHGCNVTLRCQVPAGSHAEATWEPRTPWGHPCKDSQTLCLAVPPGAFNSTFTCTARNPIEERNISIHLDTLCRQKETHGWQRWHLCLVLVAVAVGALLGGVWLWRKKKRRKKRAGRASLAFPSSEDAPPELPYTEIQRRPPEEDEGPLAQGHQSVTIYSQVQAGAGRGGQVLA